MKKRPLERALRITGTFGLFLFSLLGFLLEMLHAYKVGAYLDPENETKRLLLRLGHVHGTLLSLVALALSAQEQHLGHSRSFRLGARLLQTSQATLPLGFVLGALGSKGRDPGPAGGFIPVGAVLVMAGLGLVAYSAYIEREPPP